MEQTEYKEYHENYMKNHNGTTTIEENLITVIPIFSTIFLSVNILELMNLNILEIKSISRFLIEFIIIIIPLILLITICNYWIYETSYTLSAMVITIVLYKVSSSECRKNIKTLNIPINRPEYITGIRSSVNLLTSLCILAVDFKCFPRKLAKTENYGTGLMDAGVGLYIFCNAIITPEIKRLCSVDPSSESTASSDHQNTTSIYKTFKHNIPLFLLGILRIIFVKTIDYHEHTSEYGVHWNFFLTLAFVRIICTLLLKYLRTVNQLNYVGGFILISHEILLNTGLSTYVFDTTINRQDSLINANREGLISLPGYISLYMLSVSLGTILYTKNTNKSINGIELLKKIGKLLLISLVFWRLTKSLTPVHHISRKLANLSYICWILSLATSCTILFMLLELFYYLVLIQQEGTNNRVPDNDTVDKTTSEKSIEYLPSLLTAINFNPIFFFLFANILTGLVNTVWQTLLINNTVSLLILIGYMFVLCLITFLLYKIDYKIKFS